MDSLAHNEYVIVGKIGATYGVRGWLKITSYTESTDTLLNFHDWYLKYPDQWKLIHIEASKRHGKSIIAKLESVHTPEAARRLTGKEIAIPRSQLPPIKENEYYWADLIGLTVLTVDQVKLGTVRYLIETGANDVMIIQDEHNREHAIPWITSVIKQVSLEDKTIVVDWELI
ncbi:MAG: ribosome maturation factor RimM [Gammaproteobacteria bacterium]|nr:ribosome maturation factor RimM [Gammaproteobacteria bacterium]